MKSYLIASLGIVLIVVLFSALAIPGLFVPKRHVSDMLGYDTSLPYSRLLRANGVPENRIDDCMAWAFGMDWRPARLDTLADRWRGLHPGLPVIYDSMRVDEAYKIVASEWLNETP